MAWKFNFFRSRALRAYVDRLPHALLKDYGKYDGLAWDQISSAVERHGLSRRYLPYAVAMSASNMEFVRYRRAHHFKIDYDKLRIRIAARFFKRDPGLVINVKKPELRDYHQSEINQDVFCGRG